MQCVFRMLFQSLLLLWASLWQDVRPIVEPELDSHDRQAQLPRTVSQLGDPLFLRREIAKQKLLERGSEALPAILIGLGSCDPEIRARCVQLWPVIQRSDYERRASAWLSGEEPDQEVGFPGWARFSRRVGDSLATRRLFVKMHAAESVLLAQLDCASEQVKPQFGFRLSELKLLLENDRQRLNIQLGSVAALWYIASEIEDTMTAQEMATLQKLSAVPIVQDNLQLSNPLRSLWVAWQEARPDRRLAGPRLLGYIRDGLQREAEDAARAVLEDDGSSPVTRQFAILVLADSAKPDDRVLLTRFLGDDSPLGVYLSEERLLKTELRDVALAALIRNAGEDPRKFGFQGAKQGAGLAYSPVTLGFADTAARTAAFDAWEQFRRDYPRERKDR